MSAIKLPVEAYPAYSVFWRVIDSDGNLVVGGTSEQEAKQIALALNLHDGLVAALEIAKGSLVGTDYEIIVHVLSKAKP